MLRPTILYSDQLERLYINAMCMIYPISIL